MKKASKKATPNKKPISAKRGSGGGKAKGIGKLGYAKDKLAKIKF